MEDKNVQSPSFLGGDEPNFIYHQIPNSKTYLQSQAWEKISKCILKT